MNDQRWDLSIQKLVTSSDASAAVLQKGMRGETDLGDIGLAEWNPTGLSCDLDELRYEFM
jgi:hypothetical protein